jgi:predicted RNA-binding Zn ribbon-like protein
MQLVKWLLVETAQVASGTQRTVETTPIPRELPIVGGHLALDFANTVDDPEGPARYDHAGTYPELVGWSARVGILVPDQAAELLAEARTRARSAAVKRAHALRRILIDIFTAVAASNSDREATRLAPAVSWLDLRPFVTDAMGRAALASNGPTYELDWPITARLDGVLWPIAVVAAELLTSPQLARVKKCAGCPWVFLDQSKNFSRRWCAMNDCGTHEKIRRYVTKRAARRRS